MPAAIAPTEATEPTPPAQSTRLLPAFQNLFAASLSKTLSKCSYSAFAACFPTPAAKKPETLKTVWNQIVTKLETKALAEFKAICQERELDARFAELEDVLEQARTRRDRHDGSNGKRNGAAGLHALPPSDLFRATLVPELAPVMKHLESRTKDQQKHNGMLLQELLKKRQEIESIVKTLEDVIVDVDGANKILYAASKDLEDVD